jgi:hypothetical protein
MGDGGLMYATVSKVESALVPDIIKLLCHIEGIKKRFRKALVLSKGNGWIAPRH